MPAKYGTSSVIDPVGEWLSHQTFTLVIAGSNPVRITKLPVLS